MISVDINTNLKFADATELSVQYQFQSGEISGIYGPSGAGKTTLLNIIAGLVKPEKGVIEVDGVVWLDTDKKINIPVQRRNIGFVFQDYALFPNMTVLQNLRYAAGKAADNSHIEHLLTITGLDRFKNEKPDNLSGGQKQRVALARALAGKPKLLLLDEPLSATDHLTRIELQQQILQLQQEYRFTAIMVSHDKKELSALTTNVLKIDNGKIVNIGTPSQIFGADRTYITLTAKVIGVENNVAQIEIGDQVVKIYNRSGLVVGDLINIGLDTIDALITRK
ncbi:ATP-binding cassette domain-containing protein [Mucilaginibacter ginkgonis]|uniref:ATP-binding cassette domain-containing protein n=1 Tax=Mucilaginibacter ginkgonis TaxID=2682091 RepID=A0A6I4I761_9SPHI|nr:ATP-binding cassette domain-containing protein [Mucilaginibacter ginkgonis]QQL50738.1 ATP-binding cassette domain-containing protein [Mucilaginibacter ginkgonis]